MSLDRTGARRYNSAMILRQGYRAPDFRISTVGGVSRSLRDYEGKPTLFFGWGSWDSSREKLGSLQKFHEKNGASVRVVSIAFDAQGPAFPMRYLQPAGAAYEMLIDATCVLSRAWGVKEVPFAVLLDDGGTVQWIGGSIEEKNLLAALKKKPVRKASAKAKAEKGNPKVDIFVQGCAIYLSRARTADAANSLREALKLDPKNRIIERQIEAVENPKKVYG